MRRFVLFVVGLVLVGEVVSDENQPELRSEDSCQLYGKDFCYGASCEIRHGGEAFTCKCDREDEYFNAATEKCERKRSCKTTACSIGECKDEGLKVPVCACENNYDLDIRCRVREYFTKDCTKKGGSARVIKDGKTTAICDCGEWAVMERIKKDSPQEKCVPTTCLHPALTCKDLCERNLLGKDASCCEGWNQSDCSQAPKEGTYCPPGSIRKDGTCQDACTAGKGGLLCSQGCIKSKDPKRAYECICGDAQKVAEDGLTCKLVSEVRDCSQEETKQCRDDQVCSVRKENVVCECPDSEHEVNGACRGDCKDDVCHENFADCVVNFNRQECSCPWKNRKRRASSGECSLDEYYYTVSFKSNISLEGESCVAYRKRVLDAVQTALGTQIYMVEVLNCKGNITARLMTEKPLSKYLLKMLQTCQYPDGDFCIFYPLLHFEKDSATEIKEENLCETLLKSQEKAYKGANKCVKEGDRFWFKCEAGYREVDNKTTGRLRRSVCERVPTCTQDQKEECDKKGEDCIVENNQGVCKAKYRATTKASPTAETTVTPKVPSGVPTCTQEKKQECEAKDEDCIVENNVAVCKKRDSTAATTKTPPGVDTITTTEVSSGVPTCTQDQKEKCDKKGEECIVENNLGVCKAKYRATTKASPTAETTVAPKVPSGVPACTQEKKQECEAKDEDCIVENNVAVCKKKDSTATTTKTPPGVETITTTEVSSDPKRSGSDAVCVSVLLVLGLLTAVIHS